jgi:hypothetical protein
MADATRSNNYRSGLGPYYTHIIFPFNLYLLLILTLVLKVSNALIFISYLY